MSLCPTSECNARKISGDFPKQGYVNLRNVFGYALHVERPTVARARL